MKKSRISTIRVGLIKGNGREHKILKELKYQFNLSDIRTIIGEIINGKLRGRDILTRALFPNDYRDVSNGYLFFQKPTQDTLIKF